MVTLLIMTAISGLIFTKFNRHNVMNVYKDEPARGEHALEIEVEHDVAQLAEVRHGGDAVEVRRDEHHLHRAGWLRTKAA